MHIYAEVFSMGCTPRKVSIGLQTNNPILFIGFAAVTSIPEVEGLQVVINGVTVQVCVSMCFQDTSTDGKENPTCGGGLDMSQKGKLAGCLEWSE